MAFASLREFIAYLEDNGELARVRQPVNPRHEIAAYIRKTSDVQGPALLFESVRGSSMPVVGGVFVTRKRVLIALGATEENAIPRFLQGIYNPMPVALVPTGPCKEIIRLGDQVDLTQLPIPTYSAKDSGPYITLGIVISKDPQTGGKNAAIYRLEFKGKNRLSMNSNQQLAIQYARAEARNQPLEVAVALGVDPAILLASQWKAPYAVDELTLAGGVRGAPVEVVKCETVDLEVPATAEIVIEGCIPPHVREMEGPFGESGGYYAIDEPSPKPVIEVTAITHRRNPVFLAGLSGMPTTDNHVLKQLPCEATYYAELKRQFPGVKQVHFPACGGVGTIIIISMKQSFKHEARRVIATMLGTTRNKWIMVVDDDVDAYNLEMVLWAVATRSQWHRDLIMVPYLSPAGWDPSSGIEGSSSGLGIDATRPFDQPFPEVVSIPGVEEVPDPRTLLA